MKLLFIVTTITISLLTICNSVVAQTDTSMLNPSPQVGEQPKDFTEIISNSNYTFQFRLSIIVITFGCISLLIEAYLAKLKIIQSDHIFKCIILTMIITGSLLLITAGYSNSQINGITGLMGSIAGYLLGKTNFEDKKNTEKKI